MTRSLLHLLNFAFFCVSLVQCEGNNGCGVNRYGNEELRRIVGGREAERAEFPWQVSLRVSHPRYRVQHFCGGVIISKQWVLTAAHCFVNHLFVLPYPQFWKVTVGEHSLRKYEGSERVIDVSRIYVHPWFRAYSNDVALLSLKRPLQFNDFVRPICLSEAVGIDRIKRLECVATGWGRVDFDARPSDVLRAVKIKVFDNQQCSIPYRRRFNLQIGQWHVCAGDFAGGKGTCMGDSGGPLGCLINGRWYLMGLTSFGAYCAKPGFPDVYTRVSIFMKWIRQKQGLCR